MHSLSAILHASWRPRAMPFCVHNGQGFCDIRFVCMTSNAVLSGAAGVRVVFTSNRPPEQLYERGLNRKYFEPFVSLVRDAYHVVPLGSEVDHRTLSDETAGAAYLARPIGSYHHGPNALQALHEEWEAVTGVAVKDALKGRAGTADQSATVLASEQAGPGADSGASATVGTETSVIASASASASADAKDGNGYALPVAFGRTLRVSVFASNCAWFSFEELCGRRPGQSALGAADYIALSHRAHRLFLSEVPQLSPRRRNEARRFVMLVDAWYEARLPLHISSDVPLDQLLLPLLSAESHEAMDGAEVATDGGAPQLGERFKPDGELAAFFTAKDETFMAKRTLSRLAEMTTRRS
eukprot:1545429-Pleurochrysis_carterae.AAC.2